jgi:hypothetical protein
MEARGKDEEGKKRVGGSKKKVRGNGATPRKRVAISHRRMEDIKKQKREVGRGGWWRGGGVAGWRGGGGGRASGCAAAYNLPLREREDEVFYMLLK